MGKKSEYLNSRWLNILGASYTKEYYVAIK